MYIDIPQFFFSIIVACSIWGGLKFYNFKQGYSYSEPNKLTNNELFGLADSYSKGLNWFPQKPNIAEKYYLELLRRHDWYAYPLLADLCLNSLNEQSRAKFLIRSGMAFLGIEYWIHSDDISGKTKNLAIEVAKEESLDALYWAFKFEKDLLRFIDDEYELEVLVEKNLDLMPDEVSIDNHAYPYELARDAIRKFKKIAKSAQRCRKEKARKLKSIKIDKVQIMNNLGCYLSGNDLGFKDLTQQICEELVSKVELQAKINHEENGTDTFSGIQIVNLLVLLQEFVNKHPVPDHQPYHIGPPDEWFLAENAEKIRSSFFDTLVQCGGEINESEFLALTNPDKFIKDSVERERSIMKSYS